SAAVAALVVGVYYGWLSALAAIEVVAFAACAAFVLWAVGVLVQRFQTPICARLGLRAMDYPAPLFHSAIVAALAACVVRITTSANAGTALTAHVWFPLSLSLLALLMLRAFPQRGCVHISLASLSWGIVSLIAPSLTSPGSIALAGSVTALVLHIVERVVRPIEPKVCLRLGVRGSGYAAVAEDWSSVLSDLASVLAVAFVAGE